MWGDSANGNAPHADSATVNPRSDLPGRHVSFRLAWLLATLATSILEIASADGERSGGIIGLTIAVEVLLAAGVSLAVQRLDRAVGTLTKSALIWVLCLATGPYVLEVVARASSGTMLPLELLLLSYFRNVVLALAVFAHRENCRRFCCALSMYLTIFCSALSAMLWIQAVVVVFSIVGIWWLMSTYWESLQHRLVASSERQLPRRWLTALPLLIVLLVCAVPVAGTQAYALRGFMPSSGGMDWYSESARQGVGDGDALVAGTEHIQSFGPIEDAPFLTSHEPSLYDLFDESYNEPVKPRDTDRAIALPSELSGNRPPEQHLAESERAGREFSSLRQPGPPQKSRVGDRASAALLYVKGRVPLHLKLEVFDLYDGIAWFPESLSSNQGELRMESLNARPWLRMPVGNSIDIHASPESHALKIIHLDTNRIPSPTQLLGIHIDKVDRLDFFGWAQPGVIRMDRDKLPSLVTVQLQSRVPDERRAPAAYLFLQGGEANHRHLGEDTDAVRIRALARRWTQGVSPGWQQVRAIVAHLRMEYEHDRQAKPPVDCNHTVAHFLFDAHRGPDYLFASSTVLLLRSLGYSVRLVSGLYANPSRYEIRSRQTAVLAEDVHFWAEIRVGAGDWIPLEPTPGFDVLQPPLTVTEQVQAVVLMAFRFIVDHATLISLSVAAVISLFLIRHAFVDSVRTFAWWILPVRDERDRIRRTMRLLNSRARGISRACPRGVTPYRWLSAIASLGTPDEQSALCRLARLSDWAAFSPESTPLSIASPSDICRDAVRVWSRRRMIEATSTVPAGRASSDASERGHGPGMTRMMCRDDVCLSGGVPG